MVAVNIPAVGLYSASETLNGTIGLFPTSKLNLVVLSTVIAFHLPLAGSVDLGYVLLPDPIEQVNVSALSSNLTKLPVENPWAAAVVIVNIPTAALYSAPFGVCDVAPARIPWSAIVNDKVPVAGS